MADVNEPVTTEETQTQEPHFEPVIKLTEQVDVKTNEENEDVLFKMRAKLFRFDKGNSEWKERGTGDVRLLQDKDDKSVRLVMRRDKTLKVCANHLVSSSMSLAPNVGSDRSWVWNVAADYAEGEPTSETLAIRFANSDNANQFKSAFEDAQKTNESRKSGGAAAAAKDEEGDSESEAEEKETKEETAAAPAPAPAAEDKQTEEIVSGLASTNIDDAVKETTQSEKPAEVVGEKEDGGVAASLKSTSPIPLAVDKIATGKFDPSIEEKVLSNISGVDTSAKDEEEDAKKQTAVVGDKPE